jgi:hypothetical protein
MVHFGRCECGLDYGSDGLEVDLPQSVADYRHRAGLSPREADPEAYAALLAAMATPIDSGAPPTAGHARRKWPFGWRHHAGAAAREICGAIFEELLASRSATSTLLIYIATGTHRTNTEAELERMLGARCSTAAAWSNHDSRDTRRALERIGTTATGVDVRLNREWLAADVRITTGFVEPHFFAGFSGGPKMVAPGLAGLATVMTLHDAPASAIPTPPGASPRAIRFTTTCGRLPHGAADLLDRRGAQPRSEDHGRVRRQPLRRAQAGLRAREGHGDARRAGALRRRAHDQLGYPLDQNLYQAVKGMSGAGADRQAGWRDRVRRRVPRRPAVARLVRRGAALAARSGGAARDDLRPRLLTPDQWQVQVQAQIQLKASVLVKTSGLAPDEVRAAHFTPVDDVGGAVREALSAAGRRPRCACCRRAADDPLRRRTAGGASGLRSVDARSEDSAAGGAAGAHRGLRALLDRAGARAAAPGRC